MIPAIVRQPTDTQPMACSHANAGAVRTRSGLSSPSVTTCRDEILAVLPALASAGPDGTFTIGQVVAAVRAGGSRYATSTIRTHVTSRMCANAPDNHGVVYRDIERVSHGRYRVIVN